MHTFLIVFGFFVIAFVFMAAALQFSAFRRRGGCCGSSLEELEGNDESDCMLCPNQGSENCTSRMKSETAEHEETVAA